MDVDGHWSVAACSVELVGESEQKDHAFFDYLCHQIAALPCPVASTIKLL